MCASSLNVISIFLTSNKNSRKQDFPSAYFTCVRRKILFLKVKTKIKFIIGWCQGGFRPLVSFSITQLQSLEQEAEVKVWVTSWHNAGISRRSVSKSRATPSAYTNSRAVPDWKRVKSTVKSAFVVISWSRYEANLENKSQLVPDSAGLDGRTFPTL